MTIDDALARAAATLQSASDSPRLDAELLLAHVCGGGRASLRARGDAPLGEGAAEDFEALVRRRTAGEPVAYLLGEREFWSLPLAVAPAVLIPRPDTETLVSAALEVGPVEARIADLGTGSGAVAIALAHERPRWRVEGVSTLASRPVHDRSGGEDGYVSVEVAPSLAHDDLHLPELGMMLATDLVVLDHYNGSAILVANAVLPPGGTDADLRSAQDLLTELYDGYVRAYGPINRSTQSGLPFSSRAGLSSLAHIIGVRVSETTREIRIATAKVMA